MLSRVIGKYISNKVRGKLESELGAYGFRPITETEPQDVFIVGYPKSGNTWMQFMMTSLINGIEPSYLNLSLVSDFVPDVHYKKFYKRYRDISFFKSHHYPTPNYKKIIYLVRDGRDSMVSYYHMNKVQFEGYSLEEMIRNGRGLFPGKWHEHVKRWTDNPFESQMIIVKYEDLKCDPLQEMKRIGAFIGFHFTDQQMAKVIEGCSFEKLKQLEQESGLSDGKYRWKGNKEDRFFRKGQIGEFKNEMPASLIEYFEKEAKRELQMFGYI
jgi:hypothetical protein